MPLFRYLKSYVNPSTRLPTVPVYLKAYVNENIRFPTITLATL